MTEQGAAEQFFRNHLKNILFLYHDLKLDILKKGGTAIDAAIAANAVLGVTESGMNGIGGDLFAIVYDARTIKLHELNASGRSPYSLTLE